MNFEEFIKRNVVRKATSDAELAKSLIAESDKILLVIKELTPNGTYYVLASGNMADSLGPYYNIYQKEKNKNKIKSLIIYDEQFKKRKDVVKITYGAVKFYPLTYFPTDTFIYNDKVLIVIWNANPSFAILIINKQTSQSYKKFFDVFWKSAHT